MNRIATFPSFGAVLMSQVVIATFEDGFFKPDEPPALDPKARVRLIVEPLETSEEDETRRARLEELDRQWNDPARLTGVQDLDELLDEISFISSEPRPTRDELHDRY